MLTGATHRYPVRSTITVTKDPCGVRMRWDVLRGRSTVWTFCIGPRGWTFESQDERHTFFGRTEPTYTCADIPFLPKKPARRGLAGFICLTSTAQEGGQSGVVGNAFLNVAGKRFPTVHVRKASSFTGEIRGTAQFDFWLGRRDGVPVRIVMVSRTTNDSAVGDVHYEEVVSLRLTSLAPRR